MVRDNIIIRIIQLCIIPMDDHWSTTTGVVEQCLPGLRRFDPSPLLSEFQLGQKVDPCLLGLVPRHIIISLRPTQYTKYKSSTYKVQTKEGESEIGSANYNKSSNGNRKGNNNRFTHLLISVVSL